MDFTRQHIHEPSVVTASNIRHVPVETNTINGGEPNLDTMLVEAANQAAMELFFGPGNTSDEDPTALECKAYPERMTPQSETIQPDALVVIFESFDNLNFCYAQPGAVFRNRNGEFHHDDFIGQPFGCKIRSRTNRGLGYLYLLKPTPELWARSLKHRTQIVHELDASMIVYYLNLRPNMVVCESGTGSGALSHCIMRSIAPHGQLHTYEFNQQRADTARIEFDKNRVSHLVTVHHKDVCGKQQQGSSSKGGGFDRPQASVDAVILDLPEPWNAVPYAAHVLKAGARLASYSPCVEQSQRTVAALQSCGFHTIKTMEFRLKEYYVDDLELEMPPKEKRQRIVDSRKAYLIKIGEIEDPNQEVVSGEDTGAEADNEKSEYETEGDQGSLLTADNLDGHEEEEREQGGLVGDDGAVAPAAVINSENPAKQPQQTTTTATTKTSSPSNVATTTTTNAAPKRKKFLVARPFVNMRGHTAFLTFATAGNTLQPLPITKEEEKVHEFSY